MTAQSATGPRSGALPKPGSEAPQKRKDRLDERILRAVFYGLLGVVMMALGYDFAGRLAEDGGELIALPGAPGLLPGPGLGALDDPMTIELLAGGRLVASGAIVPGTAERFAEEIGKRGDYVRTVVLDSPGGSVRDALAMARLIREKGLDTMVEGEGRCASSCPLVFSGGKERIALDGATIGVHQVSAVPVGNVVPDHRQDMADAQAITAECQRLLVDMGVDPRVWIHAMETPASELHVFSSEDLIALSLATTTKKPAI